MLDAGIVTTAELGLMGSAFFFTYAFGKFSNGFLSDYANIGRFMSISLIASSFVCIFMGMSTASLFFILLWGINGWFQSVGSAPSCVSIFQWFSRNSAVQSILSGVAHVISVKQSLGY
ncbi:hypothetical protein I3679_001215 [Proteus mirabilis]|uniref:Major facilitator superfamily (MFS) profile domain-containing protein n=1 Tax=Proteus mirabilis TaxID=584 RepID=A0ABD5LQ98_PROMI|nr:hypothetical protein [Proteus mirabilis]